MKQIYVIQQYSDNKLACSNLEDAIAIVRSLYYSSSYENTEISDEEIVKCHISVVPLI